MERLMTVPLRRVYNRARTRRAKRAMAFLREFVARHMKVEGKNVKIDNSVNEEVWKRGIQKPPRRIRVVAVKEGDVVWVYTEEKYGKMKRGEKREKEVRAGGKTEVEKRKGEEETVKEGKGGETESEAKEKRGKKKVSDEKEGTKRKKKGKTGEKKDAAKEEREK